MSTDFTPIAPIGPINAPQIVPFTYRDGRTYLEILRDLQAYLDGLVDHVNEQFGGWNVEFNETVTQLINSVNAFSVELQSSVTDQLSDQNTAIADQLSAQDARIDGVVQQLIDDVNTAIQQVLNASIETNDAIVDMLIDDPASLTRTNLDARYQAAGNMVESVNGRSGDVVLSAEDVGASTTLPSTIPIRASDGTLPGITSPVHPNDAANKDYADSVGDTSLARSRDAFDLETATLAYGVNVMRPKSEDRVMQSVQVVSELGGEIWYSQAAVGTLPGRESTVIVRTTPAGGLIGEMKLVDAGHGTGVFVEVDVNGNIWVWSSATNHSIPSGPGRFIYTRVPWVAGKNYTYPEMLSYMVPAISGAEYLTAHYDARAGIVGVRRNISESIAQFETHTLANLLNSVVAPTDVFTYTWPVGYYGQGWALLKGKWYVYSGSSEEDPPFFNAEIWRIEAGARTLVRNVDAARLNPRGVKNGGFSEPEGISVGRGPHGEPALIIGMCTGPQTGRANEIWYLSMGANPLTGATHSATVPYSQSGWTEKCVEEWFTAPSDSDVRFGGHNEANQKFGGRISGGNLELRGRVSAFRGAALVNGMLAAGSGTRLGKLRKGYYSTERHLRTVAVKNSSATSQSISARIEISQAGVITVYIDGRDSGAASWVDFTGVSVPLESDNDG